MSRNLSVLLVEDDDPLRSVLFELLRDRGWSVHEAARGDEALELARRIAIDFSILDLHLPGMSGVEVFRRMAREIRPVPSILMSGEASKEEAQEALDLGVFKFLEKPLDLTALRSSLDDLIRAHFRTTTLPVRLEDLYLSNFPPRRRPPRGLS